MTQTISISFFRFKGLAGRLWALGQMAASRRALAQTPDIGFFKMFGTGTGAGFDPYPNWGVYALMAVWPSLEIARERTRCAPTFKRYRSRAAESWTVYLNAYSSRGAWDGHPPFEVTPAEDAPHPVAVLTRATLRRRHVFSFWRHVPGITSTIWQTDNLLFRIGMGEVPWFQQVTFSIWRDPDEMVRFAYRSDFHPKAIRDVRANGWFKEELYARFRVLGFDGAWEGRAPLPALETQAA